jgi:glycosyltransferase involved in cell wall biosynthesis
MYLFHLIFSKKIYKQIKTVIFHEAITRLIIPMPTPFDVKLCTLFARFNIEIVPIIHDANSHTGDFKLNEIFIKQICNISSKVVCLSDYTKLELIKYIPKNIQIEVVKHPVLQIIDKELNPLVKGGYFLIIGRIKKYKGIKVFIEAWTKFAGESDLLVVAGEGKIPKSFNFKPNIKIINRWLTNQEFYSLLYYSKVVVFPYKDASQSGILPMAIHFGKIIIVTKAGALVEQSKDYEKLLVAPQANTENFIEILSKVKSLTNSNTVSKSLIELNAEWDELIRTLSK